MLALFFGGNDEVIGTALTETEHDKIDRRIERSEDVATIGQVFGLVGETLAQEVDALSDSAFEELAAEARAVTMAGVIC